MARTAEELAEIRKKSPLSIKHLTKVANFKPEVFLPAKMSLVDIKNWYERARCDHWHETQLKINSYTFSACAGVGRVGLNQYMAGEVTPTIPILKRMEDAVGRIDRREAMWHEKATWLSETEHTFTIITQHPPKQLPLRSKMSPDKGEFSPFSVCMSCSGNKWLAAEVDGKQHILCYSCLPPSQWKTIGAKNSGGNLIVEYLERIYPDAELYLSREQLFLKQRERFRALHGGRLDGFLPAMRKRGNRVGAPKAQRVGKIS